MGRGHLQEWEREQIFLGLSHELSHHKIGRNLDATGKHRPFTAKQ